MKIYVLNLSRQKMIKAIVSLLLIFAVALSAIIGITMKIYGRSVIQASSDAMLQNKIVILDAGHGGEDPGACAEDGIYEKNLNLQITLEIGKALEEKGFIVVYTRTDDRLLYKEEENIKGIRKISDLKNRCKIAERYPDSIFVSIHMNSYGNSKYSGLQTYYSTKNDKSKLLAESVQNKVISELQTNNNRTIKSGNSIYVLENIENPAILIECGFMTNKEELKKLSEKEYQKQLSFLIVCGIIEYIENSTD